MQQQPSMLESLGEEQKVRTQGHTAACTASYATHALALRNAYTVTKQGRHGRTHTLPSLVLSLQHPRGWGLLSSAATLSKHRPPPSFALGSV